MKKEYIESVGAVERERERERERESILLKKSKGITLVSLVITIILLLILAGISIQAMTSTGLFEAAGRAKKEAKRAQVIEWLNLKLVEKQSENTKGTSEDIIKATQESVKTNISELETIAKDIVVEDTKTEEDGEKVDIYFYVQVDKDVYKVELKGAKFIGESGKFPPIIKIESITSTTNSITVKVSTKRNEGGKIEYWIKGEDEEKYENKKTEKNADNIEFTYTGLEQNKKYSIKIVAIAENKQTAEVTKENILIGSVTSGLKQGAITFGKIIWSGSKASIEISTNTNYTIQYQVNSVTGEWVTGTNVTNLAHNDIVYARLIDITGQAGDIGTDKNNYASTNIIDEVKPTIGNSVGSTAAGNTGTISISNIVDIGSGLTGIYISQNNTNPTATSVTWKQNTNSQYSTTVNSNGTYYIWVIDNAGNISDVSTCTVSGIVSKVNISNYSDSSVTAPNTVTPNLSYTGTPKSIEYSSSNSSIATVNGNGVVTGISVGKATITATATNYDGTTVSKSCTVSVSEYLLLGNDLKEARTGGYEWHVDIGNKLECEWERLDDGQNLVVSYAYNVGWLVSQSAINFDNISKLKYIYSNFRSNYPETMQARLVVGAADMKNDWANFASGYQAIDRTLYSDSNYWYSGELTANVSDVKGYKYLKMRLDRFADVEAYTAIVVIRSILAEP